jgi:hypothetical protein
MKKQNQLLGCFLLASLACSAQAKYWASNMRLHPLDSCAANTVQVSVGVGISTPTKDTKRSVNALNTRDLLASVYWPMSANKDKRRSFFSYGLHIGFTYALGYGKNSFSNISPYNINTQSQAPSLTTRALGSTSHVIFRAEVGPQLNFRLRRFELSAIVGFGFVGVKQGGVAVEQTTRATNAVGMDTTIRFNLYAREVTKSYGMAFLPKLRLSYFTKRFAFWVEVQYTGGHTINRSATTFVPQGPANPVTQDYTLDQIRLGGTNKRNEGANYQSWGLRLGVTWQIQRCSKKPRQKCGCRAR